MFRKSKVFNSLGDGTMVLHMFPAQRQGLWQRFSSGTQDAFSLGRWCPTFSCHSIFAQVKAMSTKLDVDLNSVRNSVYDVSGKQVQINVIVTSNSNSWKVNDKAQMPLGRSKWNSHTR
jgi:hypothetical protein